MTNWEQISIEAEKVATILRRREVDLAEAEKVGDYFMDHDYKEEKMGQYLALLAQTPPIRSKRSARHYRNIKQIWGDWQTELVGKDKARAWGWGVRLAKAGG